MTANLSPDDLAAILGPVERAASQHRIVTESHACDTCNGSGEIYVEGHWTDCLPCGGFGLIDSQYRQAAA